MKVVFLVVDGLPHRHVNERVTPHLMRLASGGARALHGGVSTMAATTYPNLRTFVTGTEGAEHGIVVNPRRTPHPARPTLLGLLSRHGVSTAAVLGDQELVDVVDAAEAGSHWPPGGVVPPGTPVDELGYPLDRAVLERLLGVAADLPDVLVAHLNDPDTAGHLLGPDSADAHERYHATDEAFGEFMTALFGHWRDLVFVVVSDHDQEETTHAEPVDLGAALDAAGVQARVTCDGSIALVEGGADADGWLSSQPHLATERTAGGTLVWGEPGVWFGGAHLAGMVRGTHGSPRTRTQVAIVSGGHAAAARLAASITARRPRAADWAPTIAALAGVDMHSATGAAMVPVFSRT